MRSLITSVCAPFQSLYHVTDFQDVRCDRHFTGTTLALYRPSFSKNSKNKMADAQTYEIAVTSMTKRNKQTNSVALSQRANYTD
jgi:hypothetical protein